MERALLCPKALDIRRYDSDHTRGDIFHAYTLGRIPFASLQNRSILALDTRGSRACQRTRKRAQGRKRGVLLNNGSWYICVQISTGHVQWRLRAVS